jgi:hypothetical protein
MPELAAALSMPVPQRKENKSAGTKAAALRP